jgi:superfamily II DNA helicase RecQ
VRKRERQIRLDEQKWADGVQSPKRPSQRTPEHLIFAGGGKSLSYQLVSQIKPGLTLVVSPLRSLMLDQVNSLKKRSITADLLTQDTSMEELQRILNAITGGFFPKKIG